MKLWEVLKALEENPEKVFINDGLDFVMTLQQDDGYVDFEVKTNGEIKSWKLEDSVDLSNDNWQEVKQPVTWQEAIEAWANGKTIRMIRESGEESTPSKRTNIISLSPKTIKYGAWYIEEGE